MQTYTDHLAAVKVINTYQSINKVIKQNYFLTKLFFFFNILQITIFQRLVIDTCL